MYCVKCGTKAEKGQKLCLACGMRLVSPETLLKLLRKADLEKKMSRADSPQAEKSQKGENFVKGYMDRLHKDEQEMKALKKKKSEKSPVQEKKSPDLKASKKKDGSDPVRKAHAPVSGPKEIPEKKRPSEKANAAKREETKKRVAPLADNPVMPRGISIFDDYPHEKEAPKAKKPVFKSDAVKKTQLNAEKPKKPASNPVVKLPEKKTVAAQSKKRDPEEKRYDSRMFYIPERKETRKKTSVPKKNADVKRTGERTNAKRPDRTKSAPVRRNGQTKKPASSRAKSSGAGAGPKRARTKRDDEKFVEKYLRSIISMMLLTTSVILMLMWCYATDTGNRTMAELGLGSRYGYILLGDDCMSDGNYKRAVEHYYKALSKRVNYEAGIKLAKAYQKTGEAEKETSALLLVMDKYRGSEEAYRRILEMYPDPDTRPEMVQNAIYMHER